MTGRISDRDHGYKKLLERVFGFARPKMSIGLLEADGAQPKAGSDEGDVTLIEVACFNEFGSADGAHPPARSFIRAWFDEEREQIRETLHTMMISVIAGQRTKDQALAITCQWCVGQIQLRIASGVSPPNAPSTIAEKGSSTPLVSTGQLRSSISYRIEPG